MASRSSLKPIFSISSASSSTIHLRFFSDNTSLLIRSRVLPGVPTTISAPFLIELIWGTMLAPPYTDTIEIPCSYFEYFSRSDVIWRQSSLVGHNISACTFLLFLSSCSRIGKPKPAVFPVPVWASPIISLPCSSMAGITFSCIGVGLMKPSSSIALSKLRFKG